MLLNLQEKSCLSLAVNCEKNIWKLGEGIITKNVNVRIMMQMKEVYLDKVVEDQKKLYYMYKGVHISNDEKELKKVGYVTILILFFLEK